MANGYNDDFLRKLYQEQKEKEDAINAAYEQERTSRLISGLSAAGTGIGTSIAGKQDLTGFEKVGQEPPLEIARTKDLFDNKEKSQNLVKDYLMSKYKMDQDKTQKDEDRKIKLEENEKDRELKRLIVGRKNTPTETVTDPETGEITTRPVGKMKTLPAGAVSEIARASAAFKALDGIEKDIKSKANIMGPVVGTFGSNNPYDTEAKAFDSKMKIIAQDIGRYLEGGKLAEGDVPRYREMLPNIKDTSAVGDRKLKNIREMMENYQSSNVDALKAAGYNVGTIPVGSAPKEERVVVINPSGVKGEIPAKNLEKALKQGYKRAQ